MTLRPHTSHDFEHELKAVRAQFEVMGGKVDDVMGDALRALLGPDPAIAVQVIERDREIDSLEVSIDHGSMAILARRQPVATDLRFVTSLLKVVTDLERMGDLAVNVAERVIELGPDAPLVPYETFSEMMERARVMLRDALSAFLNADAARARVAIGEDDRLDEQYRAIVDEVLARARQQPEALFRATRLQMIAKYIERMGDHAVNIAEMAVFIATGADIRHPGARAGNPTDGRSP